MPGRNRSQTILYKFLALRLLEIIAIVTLVVMVGAVTAVTYKAIVAPSESVALVTLSDGTTYEITSRQFQKRVKFERQWSRKQGLEPYQLEALAFGATVLDQMIREILVQDEAAQQGLTASENEVDEYIEQTYNFMRFTPTPAPTLPATPVVAVTATPGHTPASTLPAIPGVAGTATPTPMPTWPTSTPTPVDEAGFQKLYREDLQQWAKLGMTEAEVRDIARLQLLEEKLRRVIEQPGWTLDDWLVAQQPRVTRLPLWMERFR